MTTADEIHITPGMQEYIDKNNAYLAERDEYITNVVKKWKFDTIAVHGMYTVQDAIEDYQGSIIEPIFMSSCPDHTECCSTSSGMAAIMTAVQPFVVHRVHNVAEPRNFVATAQCYGGTFQLFQVRLSEERDIECRWVEDPTDLDQWERNIDKNTRFLYGELPSNPGLGFFDIRAVADLAHSHNLPLIVDSTVATPALLRPICHGADIVVQSATKTLTSSGFGICGAIIARRGIVTNIDNDDLRNNFAIYVKYMPNR
jgi:O-acetylhomoserine/O-acetylserine sulfhydrylase-like pyridoxal-dependent enzyme